MGEGFRSKLICLPAGAKICRLFAQVVCWLTFLHFSPPVHRLDCDVRELLINNWDLICFYLLIAYLLLLCPLSSNPITLPNTEAFPFFYVKIFILLYCSFGTDILYSSLPVVHIVCWKDPPMAANMSLRGVGNLVLACHQSIPSIDILLILALPNDPHTFPGSNFLKAKRRTILSCLQDLGVTNAERWMTFQMWRLQRIPSLMFP